MIPQGLIAHEVFPKIFVQIRSPCHYTWPRKAFRHLWQFGTGTQANCTVKSGSFKVELGLC